MTIAHRVPARLLAAAVLCVMASAHSTTQAPTAADGPWSGWAQCVLQGQFVDQSQTYLHLQTHTWVLTGGGTPLPASTAALKQYAATWQVTGQGTRQRQTGTSEQWTTSGQPMPDTLTLRLTAEGTLRVGGAAQLRSVGTTTGIALPYVDEWPFPVIEGPATQTTISGSAQGSGPNFTGAPAGTTITVTCSWNFVRGGGTPPAPPPPRSIRDELGITGPGVAISGLNSPASQQPRPALTPAGAPAATLPISPTNPAVGSAPPTLIAQLPPTVQDVIGSCTLRGPANNQSYGNPRGVHLYWNSVGGATGYQVLRSDLGLLTPTPLSPNTMSYFHGFVLRPGSGPYIYIVVAQYVQGCGVTTVNLGASVNPLEITASTLSLPAGSVSLSVSTPSSISKSEYSGVHLEGPGLPQGGRDATFIRFDPPQNVRLQIDGVPRGSQTWNATAYWLTGEGRITGATRAFTFQMP